MSTCKVSYYFPLPKELGNPMKRLININKQWCLIKYLNPVNKNPTEIKNVDREFAKQLNFKSVKFSFQ